MRNFDGTRHDQRHPQRKAQNEHDRRHPALVGPRARAPLSATESLSYDCGTTYNRRMVRRPAVALLALLAACSGRSAAPDFTLTSDSGAPWELAQQRSIVVLTFGFAHCADTCPTLLARLSRIATNTERTHGK